MNGVVVSNARADGEQLESREPPVILTAANAVQVEYSHYIKWDTLLTCPPPKSKSE